MKIILGLLLVVFIAAIVIGYRNFVKAKAALDALDCPKGNKVYVDAMIKCQANILLIIVSVFASCLILGLQPFTLDVVKFGGGFILFWLILYLVSKTLIVNKSIKTWN